MNICGIGRITTLEMGLEFPESRRKMECLTGNPVYEKLIQKSAQESTGAKPTKQMRIVAAA